MSGLVPFEYEGHQFHGVTVNDAPWFIARDTCGVLDIRNVSQALSYLDDDEKGVITSDTPGGEQRVSIISESGLYSLILRSRKPAAKAFKRWITHEVIPALRKNGSYSLGTRHQIPQTMSEALRMAADNLDRAELAEKQVVELEVVKTEQGKELESARPKAAYVDAFINPAEDVTTIGDFAKELGVRATDLREYLMRRKRIYKLVLPRRWSASKQREEVEYEWRYYAGFEAWFTIKGQPDAPRRHNGQIRKTLYVTPVGQERIRRMLATDPMGGAA